MRGQRLIKLTGKQRKALREALLTAFPTQTQFRMMISDALDRNLDHIALGDNLSEIVFKTIEQAEAGGWLAALIDGSAEAAPETPLAHLSVDLLAPLKSAGMQAGSLERVIHDRAPFVHVEVMIDFFKRTIRRVCLLECAGAPQGTAFLVGPDVLMTCHHVVKPFLQPGLPALDARFDYHAGPDGKSVGAGTLRKLVSVVPLASAPWSPADIGLSTAEPEPEDLDFALLKLDSPVGNEVLNGEKRGWVRMVSPSPVIATRDIVWIVQHPDGEPLRLTVDAVLRVNDSRTRVYYAANTKGGSSGSPCFDSNRSLVAMHHQGIEKVHNQGVLAAALLAHFEKQGHDKHLGGDL